MPSNFKIFFHLNRDNLHLKLMGDSTFINILFISFSACVVT
jgi:hypothetical protein